ncbi:glycosyltransferase family 90 protein [Hydnomerulius pinastri MD-312]|uniref:Glycosyltransferase family 90 protein n=1 Tax=Hydnomerulius pinastri MD-312 TaxID=994086 RepID=A0A0C9VE72_9AGAM|nr:glycosyltransferase family 90 protein [Hydnomerulius pinastri MD-312]
MANWNKVVSYRSASAILVVCIIAISLRTVLLTPPQTHVEVFSVINESHPDELPLDPLIDEDLLQPEPELETDLTKDPQLAEHTYTPDGLLIVNPNGPHPIFELIRNAEHKWNAKLARASKTLDEAVAEYKRRYKRPPPLGFDKWWDYVVKHNVQLPDEYDEIYRDLEPFWGIDPADLAHTQKELEERRETITYMKTSSSPRFEVASSTLPEDRRAQLQRTIENILELVQDVQHDLPPLRISFSPYDNPSMLSDWWVRNMALEAAAKGTTLKRSDLPPVKEAGWTQACSPDSPARLHTPSLPPLSSLSNNISPPPKTFIASHRDTMDPCMHPSLLTSHGQFLSHNAGPFPQRTLVPRFSLCATMLHHDIRPPVPYGWTSGSTAEAEGDLPWDMKMDERLDWRGSTTGIWASPSSSWLYSHRSRLATLTSALSGNISVLPVPKDASTPVGEPEKMRLGRVNPAWMDVAFAGGAVGCDHEAGTCEQMEAVWEFRRKQGRREEGRYKFIFDIDGNGWSSRFKRLITGNALIFKATIYPEWFAPRIAPWVHYVPIQLSYSDLHDAVAFFRAHDDLAAKIASAGKRWSQEFWRKEDMGAYLYRLLLEYARVSSLDRDSMSYEG